MIFIVKSLGALKSINTNAIVIFGDSRRDLSNKIK